MSTNSSQTPRIFTRGEESQFRVSFFADANQTTPLEPIGPNYPSYTIYDPSGIAIQSGIGTMLQPGQYRTNFLVPQDAPLSHFQQAPQHYGDEGQGAPLTANEARYRIEWQIVTNANQQVNFVEEFDVRDLAVTQSLNRDLKHLVLSGQAFRTTFRTTALPYKAEMKLITRGNEDFPVVSEVLDRSLEPAFGNVRWAKDGDSYVLFVDIPAGTTQGNTAYMALWTITETAFAMPVTEWNIITAINTNLFPMMTSLRMLLDRFQKRVGRLQHISDSDLLEYISQGSRMVNMSYPTTGYNMDNMPEMLQSLVLLAAGWWGLKAQSILETDLSYNFSGQSVTLSVDRTGGLDSAASNMMEMFNSQIGPAKMALVRRAGGVGTVAGRSYSYRNMYNYTYRISSMGSSQLMQTLTKIGLL